MQYVVITPARNEVGFIKHTLDSMVAQTRLPLAWVIVSDGSTDGTDNLVEQYRTQNSWIELVRLPKQRNRSFAAKVEGFNAGLDRIRHVPFDLLVSLDADIAFGQNYFEFLLERFRENPGLGVAGTPFVEKDRHYDYAYSNIEHVSGACQVFRRECFDDIGGYLPIAGGGIDWVAVTTARLKGWQTRTFTDMTCRHLRPMGTGARSRFSVDFYHGQRDYYLGGHPLWQLFRSVHQAMRPPYVFVGASLLAGYAWAWMTRVKRPVSADLVRFHRAEQMQRLCAFVRSRALRQGLK